MVHPGNRGLCHFCRPIRGLCFVNARADRRLRLWRKAQMSDPPRPARPPAPVVAAPGRPAASPRRRHTDARPPAGAALNPAGSTSWRRTLLRHKPLLKHSRHQPPRRLRRRCDDRPPSLPKMPGLPFARTRQERARPEPRRHRRQEVGGSAELQLFRRDEGRQFRLGRRHARRLSARSAKAGSAEQDAVSGTEDRE